MIIYVSHEYCGWPLNIERAKTIVRFLQKIDTDNCYICPLIAFQHIEYGELGHGLEMELCIDLLSISDKLLVVGNTMTSEMSKEVEMAKRFKMPIIYLNIKPKEFNRILFLQLLGKKPDLSKFTVSVAETADK